MTQHMRISQFVITYGPGSILEGPRGPRIIPLPDIGLFLPNSRLNPEDFEISDRRMSYGLLGGSRIFRLPSNAELNVPQTQPLYRTSPFPEWKLCHNTQNHHHEGHRGFSVLFRGRKCPVCRSDRMEHMEPVRFIMACPDGHLDDADWWYMIHGSGGRCPHSSWFRWKGSGGRLADINVECPRCRKSVNLGRAYQQSWPCNGRFPEKEGPGISPQRLGCSKNARIIQRQASNLRIPELRTLFTIPPCHTRLHDLLQRKPIYFAIAGNEPVSLQHLKNMLNNLQQRKLITSESVQEILNHPWDEIRRAIQDVLSPVSANYSDLLLEEIHTFINASLKGIPPIRGSAPSSPVLIEVDPNRVILAKGPSGRKLRIVPVSRLRTVIVQTGYRREVDTRNPAQVVDVSIPDSKNPAQRWYPGVEFFGEGIFIMLDDNNGWQFQLEGDDIRRWLSAWKNEMGGSTSQYPSSVFRDVSSRHELHPVFVWWHTLSHLLIRAISVVAGYPSASIRERVYFEIDQDRVRGGILLYAVQPGGEGTLGGLTGLVPHFRSIFDRAFNLLENCPGDPVCYEDTFQPGRYCGASCYGCLFLPETSCEHRNMWLDRRILRENLP